MRKVLVPTDFSDNALNALQYALELYKYQKCEFYIIHAFYDEVVNGKSTQDVNSIEEATEIIGNRSLIKLEAILKEIEKVSPNPRHTYKISASNNTLIDAIKLMIKEKDVDVIVLGARGKTNNTKITFGNHTLQVLKYIDCPVLAVPKKFKGIQPRHILFATDYLVPYNRKDLKFLSELAASYRSHIDLLYVSKTDKLSKRQEENQMLISDVLDKDTLSYKISKGDSITDAICDYIEQNQIDMLVMVNTSHSFFEKLFFQSKIDEICLRVDIPFLAL